MLVSCVTCGKDVSFRAGSCGHCSEPEPAKLKNDPQGRTQARIDFDVARDAAAALAAQKERERIYRESPEGIRESEWEQQYERMRQEEEKRRQVQEKWAGFKRDLGAIEYNIGSFFILCSAPTGVLSTLFYLVTDSKTAGEVALMSAFAFAGGISCRIDGKKKGYEPPSGCSGQ